MSTTVTPPPDIHEPSEPSEVDLELELLIKEARARARRRRLASAAAALIVLTGIGAALAGGGGSAGILGLAADGGGGGAAGAREPTSKADARMTAPSRQPLLYLRGSTVTQNWVEVAIYADGRVIWAIGDGDPGYLQMRLTPEAVERLRSRAVSTGLFEQDPGADAGPSPWTHGLTLDHPLGRMEVGRGSMEVRRDDRSVMVVWGKDPFAILQGWSAREVASITWAETAEQEIEVIELVTFLRDPTAWRLSSSSYVQPEISPFVPSRLQVVYDLGEPDWSALPSPAREIVGKRLEGLSRANPCQTISTDQAREIARALTQAGIDVDYDRQRGLFSFQGLGSFVHSIPALPHEVAC